MSEPEDAQDAGLGQSWSGRQRFGRVTDRRPSGSGPAGNIGTYFVSDDESGEVFAFSYADIVTEGFRTIRTGERVRFLVDAHGRGPGGLCHPAGPSRRRRILLTNLGRLIEAEAQTVSSAQARYVPLILTVAEEVA